MTTGTDTRHIGLAARLGAWILTGVLLLISSIAQAQNDGLPGGPDFGRTLNDLQKVPTICDRCAGQEAAYHGQVDTYQAARLAYETQAQAVRRLADAFLKARGDYDRLYGEFEALEAAANDILFNRGDRSMSAYDEAADQARDAEPAAREAEAALARARADLDAGLRQLERLRVAALAQMRTALRLQSAMHQCEFACDINELDLDDPPEPPETPNDQALPENIPEPENFIGVVAKCAKCLPFSERVNTIRSHRRGFAVDAQLAHDTILANRATLDRLRRAETLLYHQERALYQALLSSFTGTAPGPYADVLDRGFDARDQREAEARLRDLAAQRAQNRAAQTSLTALIEQQLQGLVTALANYHIHTALLQAAEQALADCEATCTPDSGSGTAADPFIDPDYPIPENVDLVLAKCPECQPIADELVQARVDKRKVAQDIQDAVWLVKSRERSLERYRGQVETLDAEEREIANQLIGLDRSTQTHARLVDRLFEIEDARTQAEMDMQWAEAEIEQLDTFIREKLAEHAALLSYITQLETELLECEANCGQLVDGGAIGLGEGAYDPEYPHPEPFTGVVADCEKCAPEAQALNALLVERYLLAGHIQSIVADRKAEQAQQQQRRAQLSQVLTRERALLSDWSGARGDAARAAATRELNSLDRTRERLEQEIAMGDAVLGSMDVQIEARLSDFAALSTDIEEAAARLAACERTCGEGEDDDSAISTGQDEFVTTDCAPCEVLASRVNDAVGTRIGVARDLAAARQKLADLLAEAAARQTALDTVLVREANLNEEWLTTADADRRAEIDAELHEVDADRHALEDAQATEGADQELATGEIDRLQAEFDQLTRMITDLKAQLAECERQCQPQDETQVGLGQDPSPFVTTDCPPCAALASLINDVVGTRIGVERDLHAAQARLADLQTAEETRRAALAAVLSREAALNEEWLRSDSETRRAEIDAELHEVDAERFDLEDAGPQNAADQEMTQAEVNRLQAEFDRLTQMIDGLKAQLTECEKQCQPQDETQVGLGEDPSPFVRTDCPPCAVLASRINDAVGTRIGLDRQLTAAQARLAEVQSAEESRRSALARVLAREAALNEEWLRSGDETRRAEIDAELHTVDAERHELEDQGPLNATDQAFAEEEIARLQAEVEALTRQIATLKAELADCEKQCSEEASGTSLQETPQPDPRFATTDCPECAPVVGLLNDLIGSRITQQTNLQAAETRLAELEAQTAQLEAEKKAAQDAFTEALVARNDADTDAARQTLQDTVDRNANLAADLLTQIEDIEFDLLSAREQVADLRAQLGRLNIQIEIVRQRLAACEAEHCTPATETQTEDPDPDIVIPGITPDPVGWKDLLLQKLQGETCDPGRVCDFEITVRNSGGGTLRGPVFLRETGSIDTDGNGGQFDDWYCSPADKASSLCVSDVNLAADQASTLRLPIRLGGSARNGQENCIEVEATLGTDGQLLIQLVQLGLAARGHKPGTADGIAGRRTATALAAWQQETGATVDLQDSRAVFAALYGGDALAALTDGAPAPDAACIPMQISTRVPPSQPSTAIRETPETTSVPSSTPAPQTAPPSTDRSIRIPGTNIRIGIGIGLNSGTSSEGTEAEIRPEGGPDH